MSWANVRDKLALGVLDASHILAPLPLAITLGIDSVSVPLVNVMTLQVNGNALTLSQGLWREMEEAAPDLVAERPCAAVAKALAAVVRKRATAGAPQVVLASVFPYSAQNYMLRLWLSSGGLDPDRDVRLTVVPPPHTVAHLSGGVIDGYCVGEPWNQRSVVLGIGRVALTGPDIWKGMPEKVLGTTEAWAEKNPETLKALIKALLEACQWLDEPANRAEAARAAGEPALSQHAGRGDLAHARPAGLPRLPSQPRQLPVAQPCRLVPEADGALGPGARRRSTSRRRPTASTAPIFSARPPARWASPAPTPTACRLAPRRAAGCTGPSSRPDDEFPALLRSGD